MTTRFYIYVIWILLLLVALMGCTQVKQNVIETDRFIQTDYDYNCLQGDKTFSQIIICYQAQDKAEKAQNAITNDLISKN